MENQDVLTDTKQLFLFAQIYGFVSFKTRTNEKGKKKLEIGTWRYLFAVCFQVVIQAVVFYTFVNFYKFTSTKSPSPLLFVLGVISHSAMSLSCFVTCIFSILNAKRNKKFWEKLYQTEFKLQRIKVTLNHKFLQNMTIGCVSCTVALLLITAVILIFDEIKLSSIMLLLMVRGSELYKALTFGMLNCQHILSFNIISEMFEQLEESARKKYIVWYIYNHTNHQDLLEIAKCHQQVSEVAKDGNKILSVPLLFEFINVFCYLTAATFSSTVFLTSREVRLRTLVDLMWIGIMLVVVIISVAVSHRCMNKVSGYIFCKILMVYLYCMFLI